MDLITIVLDQHQENKIMDLQTLRRAQELDAKIEKYSTLEHKVYIHNLYLRIMIDGEDITEELCLEEIVKLIEKQFKDRRVKVEKELEEL